MELAHDSPETMTHVSRKEPIICLSLNIVKLGLGRDCVVFKSHRQLCVWVASKQTPHEEVTHTNMATSPLKERFPLQGKQNLGNNGCKLAAIHSPGDRAKATGYPWSVGVLDPPWGAQTQCWHKPAAEGTAARRATQTQGSGTTQQEHRDCSSKEGWAMPTAEQGLNWGKHLKAPQHPALPAPETWEPWGQVTAGGAQAPLPSSLRAGGRGLAVSIGAAPQVADIQNPTEMKHNQWTTHPKHNIYIKSFPKHQHCKTKLHTINCY